MMKWIPGLLLAAALSSHSVDAKESRGTSTTSATKSHSTNSDTSATTTTKHSNHQSRFNQDDAREALKKGKVMPLTAEASSDDRNSTPLANSSTVGGTRPGWRTGRSR